MKSLVKDKLSLAQRMIVEEELNKRLDRYTRRFNIVTNTINAYVQMQELGWGKKRIENYFKLTGEWQKHVHERYGEDEIFAMQFKLKEKGIDVVALTEALFDDDDAGKTEIIV